MTRPRLVWRADHSGWEPGEREVGFTFHVNGDNALGACWTTAGGGESPFELEPERGAELLLKWFWFHRRRYVSNEQAATRRRRFMRLVPKVEPATADDQARQHACAGAQP